MQDSKRDAAAQLTPLGGAEITALAHLYRAEVYRSTALRSRFDNTTNWSIVTTGIALSATFAGPDASPLPLVLVGLLVTVFLLFEARRYIFFDVWRMRTRTLENEFFAPILRGEAIRVASGWGARLADDYRRPRPRISLILAIGRRLRRNYSWILVIQAISYYGKLAIHPTAMTSLDDIWSRAAIGPLPGHLIVAAGVLFHGGWLAFALATLWLERVRGGGDEVGSAVAGNGGASN